MSTFGSPPLSPPPPVPAGSTTGKPRATGWLTAFAILAIAVGAMQILGGLSKAATPAMMRLQQQFIRSIPQDRQSARMQAEMQSGLLEAFARYRTPVLIGAFTRPPVGAALIIGGIGCLRLRRRARLLLVGAFAAALILELGFARSQLGLQMDTMAVNQVAFERSMQHLDGVKPETDAAVRQVTGAMGSFMKAMTSAGTIGFIVVMVLTAAACAAGMFFMLHPRTRAQFEPASPS